ncbi:MAG: CpcD phycobilisome linker protein [Synechococcaceae cyanobacterium SM2_3_1]|nr:CpcD phycobilisome linker protein [Synechococcaceae cyanobacterium SM2_3_1]
MKAEDPSLAGAYEVDQILSPAAPRGWRLFLVKPGVARVKAQPGDSSANNTDKLFNVEVSGLIGPNVRKSVTSYLIPFSRLSQEVKRITRTGAKIVRISESSPLAPRSQD